jgi:hypothetical protein
MQIKPVFFNPAVTLSFNRLPEYLHATFYSSFHLLINFIMQVFHLSFRPAFQSGVFSSTDFSLRLRFANIGRIVSSNRMVQMVALLLFLPAFLSAQCISGNCQNGTGTQRYMGNVIYTGRFVGGLREGSGKLTLSNGNVYEGNFIKNKMQGEGTMTYSNGDRYVGSWSNDQPAGKGKYYFKSGERYEGAFANGKFEGQGVMRYPDGAYYTGAWLGNKKHGTGKLVGAGGDVLKEGQWNMGKFGGNSNPTGGMAQKPQNNAQKPSTAKPDLNGVRNCNSVFCRTGQGHFSYPDGSRWIGEFKDGYPNGRGICYYSNGDRYEGEWVNNAPSGKGVMHFASGRVYGAVWMNGAPIKELDSNEEVPDDPIRIESSKNVKIWAVIVGVGRYTAMPSLKFTDDDAYRFYSFLKSPEGGALPDNQISVLVDDAATRENILGTMRQNFLKADANDVVLLYFSGHGLDGCFLPVDFDGYNNKLRHDEIKQIFKQSKAKHKLCIADACHSGSLRYDALAAKGPAPVTLDRFYRAFEETDGGIALLMSSKAEELSLEDHGLRQGVFTYYILKGLKGGADPNGDNIVTVKELYNYVYTKVREYTANVQTPVLTGNYDDDMPVALKRN